MLDIGVLSKRLIASAKVVARLSQVEIEMQDVPQAKSFQSEGRHSQEEFDNVVNDPIVPEADDSFTPDVFGDTYVNMELAIPSESARLQMK